jgi:hypothetical protein
MAQEKREAAVAAKAVDFGISKGLQLVFSNGKTLVVNPLEFAEEIREQAMIHGFKQKLIDAAAIGRDPDTGKSATIDDKYEAVREVFDRLAEGEWNKPREGAPTGGLLLRALLRYFDGKKDREQLVAWLGAKSDAEKAALRKNAKIAAIIEEIKAEREDTDGIDSDALLEEAENDDE